MAKFKVGDRVRRVRDSLWPKDYGVVGKEYDVISVDGVSGSITVIAGKGGADAGAFELVAVAPAAATATLKIEAGKFYKTRDGRKVGPLIVRDDDEFPFLDEKRVESYRPDGSYNFNHKVESHHDLVSEWVDEPAVPRKFKVGDRVRFTDKVPGSWWFKSGQTGVITGDDESEVWPYIVEVDGAGSKKLAFCGAEHIELVAPLATTPIEVTLDIDMNPPLPPQVGDDVLIFGTISAINHSPRGTNYNIVFETQNRRMSLHFLEEDFIVDPEQGDGGCACANDDGPPPSPDTAKAFDAIGAWLRSLAVQRAA